MSDLLYFIFFLRNQVCLFYLKQIRGENASGWLMFDSEFCWGRQRGVRRVNPRVPCRVTQMPSDADVSWAGTAEEPRHSGTFRGCMRVVIVSWPQQWPRARQHRAVHLSWCCFFLILIPGQRRNLDQVSTTTCASGEAKYLTAFFCWNFAWKSPFFYFIATVMSHNYPLITFAISAAGIY